MDYKITTGDNLCVSNMSNFEYGALSDSGLFKWNKTTKELVGKLCLETLNLLAQLEALPYGLESFRESLVEKKRLMDEERAKEKVYPIYAYPVKVALMEHQVRGANLAMLNFGYDPKTGKMREDGDAQ